MQEYVAGLFFDDNAERIALVLKNRPTWQAGNFNGIGGKVELGETPDMAMVRECIEEAGVEIDWQYRFTYTDPNEFAVHWFATFSTEGLEAIQAMEDEEIMFFDPMNLPSNTVYNLRWIIPMLLDEEVVVPEIINCTVTE